MQESRQYLKAGRLDEAEEKARKAQRMGVVPGLETDRAESVLHEIAMVRAKSQPPAGPVAPAGADPRGGRTRRASARSQGRPSPSTAEPDGSRRLAAAPATDPAVQRIAATEPNAGPGPRAPRRKTAPSPSARDRGRPALAGPGRQRCVKEPAPRRRRPPGNRGEQLLAEAKALYTNANYAAALQLANEAKAGKFGVEAQANELIAQINMAAQARALSLYEEALASLRKGDNQRARGLLTEVAADETFEDESCKPRSRGSSRSSPGAGRAGTPRPTDAAQDAETLAAQKLNAEVGTKIAEARRYHEIDPDKAIAIYEKTMQGVQGSGLPPELTRPMVRRLEVALELARKDKAQYLVKMVDKKQREEIELKRLRILEADKAKKIRVKEFMDKATSAYAESKYVECETYAKKAMEIDPNELAASILAYKAKMNAATRRTTRSWPTRKTASSRTLQEVDLASVSDPEVQINGIKYAKNFKDLTRERLAMNARLQPRKDPKVLAIEAKLKEPISINVDKQSLGEAVKFIQDYTGLNIVIDPKGLNDEGVTSAAPVSPEPEQRSGEDRLEADAPPARLDLQGRGRGGPDHQPAGDPGGDLRQDLLRGRPGDPAEQGGPEPDAPQCDGPRVLQCDSMRRPAGVNTMGYPNAANPHHGAVPNGVGVRPTGDRRWVDLTPLVQLVATSVAPGTWQVHDGAGADVTQAYGLGGAFGGGDAGGLDVARPIGAITPFFLSISLIIRHTAEVHEQVADLLRQLRRLQDLQVLIEVRFITVQDNFYEQIGVDFDFQIQSDTVGKHTTFAAVNPSQSLFPIPGVTGGLITGTSTTHQQRAVRVGPPAGPAAEHRRRTGGGTTGGGDRRRRHRRRRPAAASGGGTGGGAAGGGDRRRRVAARRRHGRHDLPTGLHREPGPRSCLGNNTPFIVGTQGGGIGNFSPNLDIPFTNTQASLIAPTFVNNYQPQGGATFGIAFLSDLEVYLFLTAAQGDTRSNVLLAPKVTTFNGAAATIFSNTVQYYVAGLTPIIGPGAVAYTPQVSHPADRLRP